MITVIIIIRRRPVNEYSVSTLKNLWHSPYENSSVELFREPVRFVAFIF
jgi:hypothetical protein